MSDNRIKAHTHIEGTTFTIHRAHGDMFHYRVLSPKDGTPADQRTWELEVTVTLGRVMLWYPCATFRLPPSIDAISQEQRNAQAMVKRAQAGFPR